MESKQKIILFVGADMCGKTQIAHELSRRINVPTFKASSEHKSFLDAQNQFIQQLRHADPRVLDLLKQTGHSVIFDRAYPCEKVYAEFFNRPTDASALEHLDIEYSKLGAKIVICHRSSYDGIVDDLDSKLDSKALQTIDLLYQKFLHWTRCETLLLNVDDENLDREVNDIMEFLNHA